jgi:hypothetical protein
LDDAAFTVLFSGLASRPRRGHVQFAPVHGAIMADMLRKVAGSRVPETHEAHRISLTIASRFRGTSRAHSERAGPPALSVWRVA